MKINIICAITVACASMAIISMDLNAAMRQQQQCAEQGRNQRMFQQMRQQQITQQQTGNAAVARIYQAKGQLVPPQVMAQLDPGSYALACRHNQNVLQ